MGRKPQMSGFWTGGKQLRNSRTSQPSEVVPRIVPFTIGVWA
jgi:hypothetical protein